MTVLGVYTTTVVPIVSPGAFSLQIRCVHIMLPNQPPPPPPFPPITLEYISQKTCALVSLVGGDEYVCPLLFCFLTVQEVGIAAVVCQEWCAGAEDDELWRAMYERTQVGRGLLP